MVPFQAMSAGGLRAGVARELPETYFPGPV